MNQQPAPDPALPPGKSGARRAPSSGARGVSLRVKLALLLALVALVPSSVASQLLLEVNREAVQSSERQLQSAVAAEVTGLTTRSLERGEQELRTIARVVASTAHDPTLLEPSLRPVLESARNVSGVRLEIPSTGLSHVLSRVKGDSTPPPESTPALRELAEASGVAFSAEAGDPVMVVLVPKPTLTPHDDSGAAPPAEPTPEPAAKPGATAFITGRISLGALREQVSILAEMRFEGAGTRILLVDQSNRVIAEHGVGLAPGADASGLPLWKPLNHYGASQQHSGGTRVGVVEEFEADGDAWVGGLETVPDIGWTAAVWRPQAEAYASLTRMRRRGLLVVAISAGLALLLGFIGGSALARPILRLAGETRLIARRAWGELAPLNPRGDELGQLARSIRDMAHDLKSGEEQIANEAKLRGDLGRFLSAELVDAIVSGEHSLTLGGQRREVSVAFADVVAFTPLAESRQAEEVVALLNELFSVLTEIVFRHHGTVDKFIGDCIMAVWGAPVEQADHADRALAAAEDMLHFLETANVGWRERFGVEVRIGVGINSGEAIVGNIGSDKRMEYTVIGDVVNVAARLESIAQPNQILVAEPTHARCSDSSNLRALGEHNLTGRDRAVQVFELDWR